MNLIEFKNVNFGYDKTLLLSGLNFAVEAGERISIVGNSGSGKSTLLKIMSGLLKPTSGSVVIDGQNKLSFLFQRSTLLPWKNVSDNIEFISGCDKNKIVGLLKSLGVEISMYKYPNQLSGGMSQRVNMACVLAAGAKILLMDEPFSSLDYLTKLKNYYFLRDTIHNNGITSILVTHDIKEALFFSNKIFIISDKGVLESIKIAGSVKSLDDLMDKKFMDYHQVIIEKLGINL